MVIINLTSNLKLQKPTSDEKYNVQTQNTNMDILDSSIKSLQDKDATLTKQTDFTSHTGNKNNPHNVTKEQLGLSNVVNQRQIPAIQSTVTDGGVPIFDGDGYTLKDSGFTIKKSIPEDAKFTDTLYVHPSSGVIPNTYKSVDVDEHGHVVGGFNPTTLDGYGITDASNINHTHTAEEVGALGVENLNEAIIEAKEYSDSTYIQSTGYTDAKIVSLINGAPSTLDTLKEISDAIEENQTVVESLESAIGNKANEVEFQSHQNNNTIHVTASDKVNWNDTNSKKHTHDNKSVIDTITQALIDTWNAAFTHISDTIKHITATERTNWNAAKAHADSVHAPSNAQKNSDITKSEIESKLTGTISTHNHSIPTMTTTVNGIGKPDNITIGVNNGTFETKFKTYRYFAELGLTAPKTCLEIATAMPNDSEINIIISASAKVSDVPHNTGLLSIIKLNDVRCFAQFEFSSNVSTAVPRVYTRFIRPSEGVISDWTEYLTTGKLTNNLLATVPGTALDAVQGKELDTRVTTNTNDIDTLNRNLSAALVGYNGKEIDLTWAQIEAKAAAGDFTDINIGDYKDIILTTGEKVRMEVAGLDTYYGYQSNNNHRIYFISRDCLATLYAMNSTDTNTGGFPASALKATLNGTIYNTLPAEIRNVIKTDKRLCSTKGSWAWQEDQKLWLPSEVEVWGHNTWSEVGYGNGCGIQFPIFTGSLRHICKGQGIGKAEQGSRVTWWCDSPYASNTTYFCHVASIGIANYTNASTALGVPLCFTL